MSESILQEKMEAAPVQQSNAVSVGEGAAETVYSGIFKSNFGFFGGGALLYSCFYAFCMFRNPSGVTFPFFIAGSLLFFCFCIAKLGISLRKGSGFYMVSLMLLAVSTFCTDDGRIITMNKWGIFLLMMSLLVHQFHDTSAWQLGKYMGSFLQIIFCSLSALDRPFADGNRYRKSFEKGKGSKVFYAVVGFLVALPLFAVIFWLLLSADAVFREGSRQLLGGIDLWDICQVIGMVALMFFAVYCLLSYLCEKNIKEEVKDRRKGEPVLAITVTGMLTALYLVFSVIQIVYLFLGQMQLPAGYTYAEYAREGFFQLLAVSVVNLIIVLVGLSYFRESKVLKAVLTVMSFCTFIMIASSGLRMIIYIQYYYLTFLRIFVLWSLVVLALLFGGIVAAIFRKRFPLFRYCCVAVTCCYLVLSFSHPDYWIAKVNVANIAREETGDGFFKGEPYGDVYYLNDLCADAAPVLVPWLAELEDGQQVYGEQAESYGVVRDSGAKEAVPEYIRRMNARNEKYDGWLKFNVSRFMAKVQVERFEHGR